MRRYKHKDFRSVSTSAARYQQLSLNPQKLAGQCGKLKCCLNFELDQYVEAVKDFPSPNAKIKLKEGRAFVFRFDSDICYCFLHFVEQLAEQSSLLWFPSFLEKFALQSLLNNFAV